MEGRREGSVMRGEKRRDKGKRDEMRRDEERREKRDEKERDGMNINERKGRLAGVYRRHDEDRFLTSPHIFSSNVTYDIRQHAT
jgi:hypothetical protein